MCQNLCIHEERTVGAEKGEKQAQPQSRGEKLHRGNLLNVKGCKELREVNVESDSKWKENSTHGKVQTFESAGQYL